MEMEKKGETQRGGIKEIENEDYAHKILFAAGTAILMACLKRAILVSFAAQWRWWVFVVLNLVLLAIVFMSTSSTARENQEINTNVDKKRQRKQKRKQYCRLAEAEVDRSECCYEKALSNNVVESIGTVEDNGDELPSLSKEELNERVEAFIVMFKKHLATDAKNGRGDFFSYV